MGKRGNKIRQTTRRGEQAKIQAREYLDAKQRAEEQMRLEDAYGNASLWDDIDDPAFTPLPVKEKEVEAAEKSKYRVTLLKDHKLEYPNLGLQVFMSCPNPFDIPSFIEMFTRSNCMKANSVEEADICIFGGGPDVDPGFYGEVSVHPKTRPDPNLDANEMELYYHCYGEGIPMVGICRGAQFLWAMNEGKLFQDVDNHGRMHPIVDRRTGQVIERASSVHHQMCYPNLPEAEILATANVSRNRWLPSNVKDIQGGIIEDIEAYFIPETACLGFQGHPEYKGFNFYTQWCLQQLEDLILDNPDIELRQDSKDPAAGLLRIKKELIDERTAYNASRSKK
jgi:putative glutamine amidotransferase